MQVNILPLLLLCLPIIAIRSLLGMFCLRAACAFHNYVSRRIVEEYEIGVRKSGRQFPPVEDWAYAPKFVEEPDFRESFIIEMIAQVISAVIGVACTIAASAVGFSPLVPVFLGIIGGIIALASVFCAMMSAPLEKGLLIALLENVIAVLIAAAVACPIIAVALVVGRS